ncbi:hypothetical protein L1987_58029 [Smallanthus sonchifolius]|uniref:Uncharacterized protein n=1 Tax=Smallanthus sonchifolius TaxID=185202 RepID=A0ACB9DEM6_9ASTR|nr:hypothetical protein L1987_58029 [Smallanthus sonchifolius]
MHDHNYSYTKIKPPVDPTISHTLRLFLSHTHTLSLSKPPLYKPPPPLYSPPTLTNTKFKPPYFIKT